MVPDRWVKQLLVQQFKEQSNVCVDSRGIDVMLVLQIGKRVVSAS